MRSKEDAKDYRYFPEPDLVPVVIDDEWLKKIRDAQPELRDEKMLRYKNEYDIPEYDISIITSYKKMADIFEETVRLGANPKKASNWLMVETMRLVREEEIEPDEIKFSPANLAALINMVEDKTINGSVAKEVFEHIFREDVNPQEYVKEHNLKSESNEDELRELAKKVIEENPQSVEDYRNGKKKAAGFLVGQMMKATQGKADPGIINKLLQELL